MASGGAAPKIVYLDKNFRGGPDDRTRILFTIRITKTPLVISWHNQYY